MLLRDYQLTLRDRLVASIRNGHRSPVCVLPTGGGKTLIAAALIQGAHEKGNSSVFFAPRRELVYQTSERLRSIEHEHGIIMAGEDQSLYPSTQVACIPTLHARAIQRDKISLPPARLALVDEAHIGIGGRAQELIKRYVDSGAIVVGLTATPARTDGRGLGEIYDDLVLGPSVQELIDGNHLVQPRYFSGTAPDLSDVPVTAGDYNQKRLGERTDKAELIGDVVENWFRLASDRQTFVFCVNVSHSRHLRERFRAHGVEAEHVDGTTPLDERKEIMRRLRTGEIRVLCNCEVMTYGVDFPPVSCIVMARPTKSITRYMQMGGRGLRTHPGKEDCMVLDHAGVIEEMGFLEDPVPWTLDSKKKVQDLKKDPQYKEPKEIACPKCDEVFRPAKTCPGCGHEMGARFTEAIEAHEAELEEIDKTTRAKKKRDWSVEEKGQFFGELKWYVRERGNKPGRAVHLYKAKLGVLPFTPGVYEAPERPPSQATLAWITSQNIRHAKRHA